jgi:hypothetical protein
MKLSVIDLPEYISSVYGVHRGAAADFLRDNPHILPQELTRWKKTRSVHTRTGEMYKAASKLINLRAGLTVDIDQDGSEILSDEGLFIQKFSNEDTLTLKNYITMAYGSHRGATADFLRDNPAILPQELSRWKKNMNVFLATREIYKSTVKRIKIKTSLNCILNLGCQDFLVEEKAKWFLRTNNITISAKGFTTKLYAALWIESLGDRVDWRDGYVFRLKDGVENIEVISIDGQAA